MKKTVISPETGIVKFPLGDVISLRFYFTGKDGSRFIPDKIWNIRIFVNEIDDFVLRNLSEKCVFLYSEIDSRGISSPLWERDGGYYVQKNKGDCSFEVLCPHLIGGVSHNFSNDMLYVNGNQEQIFSYIVKGVRETSLPDVFGVSLDVSSLVDDCQECSVEFYYPKDLSKNYLKKIGEDVFEIAYANDLRYRSGRYRVCVEYELNGSYLLLDYFFVIPFPEEDKDLELSEKEVAMMLHNNFPFFYGDERSYFENIKEVITDLVLDERRAVNHFTSFRDYEKCPDKVLDYLGWDMGGHILGRDVLKRRKQVENLPLRWKQKGSIAGLKGRLEDIGSELLYLDKYHQVRPQKIKTQSWLLCEDNRFLEDGIRKVKFLLDETPWFFPDSKYRRNNFDPFFIVKKRDEGKSQWELVSSIYNGHSLIDFEFDENGNVFLVVSLEYRENDGSVQKVFFEDVLTFTEFSVTYPLEPFGFNIHSEKYFPVRYDFRDNASGFAFFEHEGKKYIFGGIGNLWGNDVYITEDGVSFEKVVCDNKPMARRGNVSFSLGNGKFLIFGGETEDGIFLGDTWIFDMESVTWERVDQETSPIMRSNASLLKAGENFYIFGGFNKYGDLGDLWIWDNVGLGWEQVQDMGLPPSRCGGTSIFSNGDLSYTILFGGWSSNDYFLNDLYFFDETGFHQIFVDNMPTPRASCGCCLGEDSSGGIFLYVFSGVDGDGVIGSNANISSCLFKMQIDFQGDLFEEIVFSDWEVLPKENWHVDFCTGGVSGVLFSSGDSSKCYFSHIDGVCGRPQSFYSIGFNSEMTHVYLTQSVSGNIFSGQKDVSDKFPIASVEEKFIRSDLDSVFYSRSPGEDGGFSITSEKTRRSSFVFETNEINQLSFSSEFFNREDGFLWDVTLGERSVYRKFIGVPHGDDFSDGFVDLYFYVKTGDFSFKGKDGDDLISRGFNGEDEYIFVSSLQDQFDEIIAYIGIRSDNSVFLDIVNPLWDEILSTVVFSNDVLIIRTSASEGYANLKVYLHSKIVVRNRLSVPFVGYYKQVDQRYFVLFDSLESYFPNVKISSAKGSFFNLDKNLFFIYYDSFSDNVGLCIRSEIPPSFEDGDIITIEGNVPDIGFDIASNRMQNKVLIGLKKGVSRYKIHESYRIVDKFFAEPMVEWGPLVWTDNGFYMESIGFKKQDYWSVFLEYPYLPSEEISLNSLKFVKEYDFEKKSTALFLDVEEGICENENVLSFVCLSRGAISLFNSENNFSGECYNDFHGWLDYCDYGDFLEEEGENGLRYSLDVGKLFQYGLGFKFDLKFYYYSFSIDLDFENPLLNHMDYINFYPVDDFNWQIESPDLKKFPLWENKCLLSVNGREDFLKEKDKRINEIKLQAKYNERIDRLLDYSISLSYPIPSFPVSSDLREAILQALNGVAPIIAEDVINFYDWMDLYILSLPLADSRIIWDLDSYKEWRSQTAGEGNVLAFPSPPIDYNTRLISVKDPFLDLICNPLNPYPHEVIFGYLRTKVPYGETVFNVDEYDGSIRPSKDPCDIDYDFVDPCGCCPSSCIGIGVEKPFGLRLTDLDLDYVIDEMTPASCIVRFKEIQDKNIDEIYSFVHRFDLDSEYLFQDFIVTTELNSIKEMKDYLPEALLSDFARNYFTDYTEHQCEITDSGQEDRFFLSCKKGLPFDFSVGLRQDSDIRKSSFCLEESEGEKLYYFHNYGNSGFLLEPENKSIEEINGGEPIGFSFYKYIGLFEDVSLDTNVSYQISFGDKIDIVGSGVEKGFYLEHLVGSPDGTFQREVFEIKEIINKNNNEIWLSVDHPIESLGAGPHAWSFIKDTVKDIDLPRNYERLIVSKNNVEQRIRTGSLEGLINYRQVNFGKGDSSSNISFELKNEIISNSFVLGNKEINLFSKEWECGEEDHGLEVGSRITAYGDFIDEINGVLFHFIIYSDGTYFVTEPSVVSDLYLENGFLKIVLLYNTKTSYVSFYYVGTDLKEIDFDEISPFAPIFPRSWDSQFDSLDSYFFVTSWAGNPTLSRWKQEVFCLENSIIESDLITHGLSRFDLKGKNICVFFSGDGFVQPYPVCFFSDKYALEDGLRLGCLRFEVDDETDFSGQDIAIFEKVVGAENGYGSFEKVTMKLRVGVNLEDYVEDRDDIDMVNRVVLISPWGEEFLINHYSYPYAYIDRPVKKAMFETFSGANWTVGVFSPKSIFYYEDKRMIDKNIMTRSTPENKTSFNFEINSLIKIINYHNDEFVSEQIVY